MLSKPDIFHLFLLAVFRAKVMFFAFRWDILQMSLIAVTNARIASLHGLPVATYPFRRRPFHSAKPRVRHERKFIGRNSGGLPSAVRRRRCALTSFPPSLRLCSTFPARQPQTEASSK
jgi:hypothetical protein